MAKVAGEIAETAGVGASAAVPGVGAPSIERVRTSLGSEKFLFPDDSRAFTNDPPGSEFFLHGDLAASVAVAAMEDRAKKAAAD